MATNKISCLLSLAHILKSWILTSWIFFSLSSTISTWVNHDFSKKSEKSRLDILPSLSASYTLKESTLDCYFTSHALLRIRHQLLKFINQFCLFKLVHEGNQYVMQPTCHMCIAYVETVELLEQFQRLVELLLCKCVISRSIGEGCLNDIVYLLSCWWTFLTLACSHYK